MRRDTVVAIAVEVAPDCAERHVVALLERAANRVQHGVRECVAVAEPARETRVVDHAFPHATTALTPLDRFHEHVEHVVGAAQPVARDVDPRPLVERDPFHRDRRVDRGVTGREERSLAGKHARHRRRTRVRRPRPG